MSLKAEFQSCGRAIGSCVKKQGGGGRRDGEINGEEQSAIYDQMASSVCCVDCRDEATSGSWYFRAILKEGFLFTTRAYYGLMVGPDLNVFRSTRLLCYQST